MFNLINKEMLEKKENAKKAEAALKEINKVCTKYASVADETDQLTILSAYLLFLTAQTDKDISFQDLIEKKVFVDLDFRRQCKINYYKDCKKNASGFRTKIYDEMLKDIEEDEGDYRKIEEVKNGFKYPIKDCAFISDYMDKYDPYISADECFKKGVMLSINVDNLMNEKLWNHLKNLLKKYSAEIFKEVALCATSAEALNANEAIGAIAQILEIKDDDAFLFDGDADAADFMSFYQLNKKTHYALNSSKIDLLIRGAFLPENVKVWSKTPEHIFDKIIFCGYMDGKNRKYKDSTLLSNGVYYDNNSEDEDAVNIVSRTTKKFGIDEQALTGADNQILYDFCNLLENFELLKKAKKAICLLPNEALNAKCYEPFRRILVENGFVENILGGKEKSFLVLSNGNKEVYFYKAYDNFFRFHFNSDDKNEIVANADIIGNDANLYFETYLYDDSYLKNAVSLEDITKKSFRGVSCTTEELKKFVSNHMTTKRFLKYSDIKDGIISNDMQSLFQVDEKYKKYCAERGDLIISKICSPFKVSVIEGNAREILVGDNLYVIRLDAKQADPYCVKAFLESSKGKRQIEKILSGKKSRALSLQDVLGLKIELIDKEAQCIFSEEYKKQLHDIIEKQLFLSQKLEKLSHMWER